MREQEELLEQKELRLQLLEERNNKLKELKRQAQQGGVVSYEDIEILSEEDEETQQEGDTLETVQGGEGGNENPQGLQDNGGRERDHPRLLKPTWL
jgi:hypothetical protein